MSASFHPDPATLMAYAAGTLDEAFAVVVSCHLETCDQCAQEVRDLERLGGASLDNSSEARLSDGAFGRVLEKIYVEGAQDDTIIDIGADTDEGNQPPSALQSYLEGDLNSIPWKRVSPGVWQKQLNVGDGAQSSLRLLRIASGKKVPEHGHGGHEMTLILSGAYEDEIGHFAKGDVADLDDHVEHQPFVVSDEDCICLVATEAPTKFKSLAGRIMQPFVGI